MMRRKDLNSSEWPSTIRQNGATDGGDADETLVLFVGTRKAVSERYALDGLFLEWAWNGGFAEWDLAVRTLARTLRGLQTSGLIERRTIRRVGCPTHHGFVVTALGQQALHALS